MKKDVHIQKLKTVIFKLESHMKLNLMQNQETINKVGSLTFEELNFLEDQIKQLGESFDPFVISDQQSETKVVAHIDKQIQKQFGGHLEPIK